MEVLKLENTGICATRRCKIEISVWNTLTNYKQPFITHTYYIRTIDKDSSHYRRLDRVNTGEIEFPHER
jgi:hypothetical protein